MSGLLALANSRIDTSEAAAADWLRVSIVTPAQLAIVRRTMATHLKEAA
jgi:hypothetical protein